MPIQAPQWSDYLNCPVCCREFGESPRSPVSLRCGHTFCADCLKHLNRKQCPFDQTVIYAEPDEIVVNTALLQLAGVPPPPEVYHPPSIKALPEQDRLAYNAIVRCLDNLALFLKYASSTTCIRLSRPMQRKLVTLLQCAITDEEGRVRAARSARSLGERTVTELILQHQNPQQLSANLWAAVRARGCQFLGPAMQEEVLKLVLLALEDGSALSRKVLVMFVVQRLEPHFPQASKTSIGHVVQLLYRASCFKVSKRECDSSLMQLKEEFRTYESLRREHDAQIVQIATEAGLRIAPDQWSALLYGDTVHKSHMQSIIDKLQTPQSFAQSVQELFIALQRTWDPAQLVVMSMHLDRLANIDGSPDAKCPTWQQLAEMLTSIKEVVSGLVHYLQYQVSGRDPNHNQRHTLQDRCCEPSTSQLSSQTGTPTHKNRTSLCRETVNRAYCQKGNSCTFHFEEDLERYNGMANSNASLTNGNYTYLPPIPPIPMPQLPQPIPVPQMFQRFPMPPPQAHPLSIDNYNVPHMASCSTPSSNLASTSGLNPSQESQNSERNITTECIPSPQNYATPIIRNRTEMGFHHNNLVRPRSVPPYFGYYGRMAPIPEEGTNMVYTGHDYVEPLPYQNMGYNSQPNIQRNMYMQNEKAMMDTTYNYSDLLSPTELLPDFLVDPGTFAPMPTLSQTDPWLPTNDTTFNFQSMSNTLQATDSEDTTFNFQSMSNSLQSNPGSEDLELEEGLQALQRRMDTEYESD